MGGQAYREDGLGSYAILAPKIGDFQRSVKKVLLIRFSSIGDIVLTTPVIRVLKENSEERVELHYLVKAPFRSLLEANPRVDRIHLWEQQGNKPLLEELRNEGFDHVVDLQGSLRSRRVRHFLAAPSSGFPKLNKEKWLLVNLGIDRLPREHVVDRYFQAVQGLGLKNDGKGLEFFIPSGEELDGQSLGLTRAEPFIAFSIGGAHETKKLPVERIIELCRRIELPVVLLGGPEDAPQGQRVAEEVGRGVIDRCGQLSISGSASLIKKSAAVLTHDTGMMHIAAAFGKEIISFWGNTVPEFGMYPYMPEHEERSHLFEVDELSCRPCSKIGYKKCPKGHFRCMWDIDTEEVLRTLDRILKKES